MSKSKLHKKKFRVPVTHSKEKFVIPACEKCGEDLVIFKNRWACKECMKIEIQIFPGWKAEEIPFGVLYPNRESRRK